MYSIDSKPIEKCSGSAEAPVFAGHTKYSCQSEASRLAWLTRFKITLKGSASSNWQEIGNDCVNSPNDPRSSSYLRPSTSQPITIFLDAVSRKSNVCQHASKNSSDETEYFRATESIFAVISEVAAWL